MHNERNIVTGQKLNARIIICRFMNNKPIQSAARNQPLIDTNFFGVFWCDMQNKLFAQFRKLDRQVCYGFNEIMVLDQVWIVSLNQCHNARSPRNQLARRHIWHIIQLFSSFTHTFFGIFANVVMPIQCATDLGHRYPQMPT